mgnify:CR=1 FL=1
MSLFAINVHEKTSQKVKTDEILKACKRCLYFALVLHENALVFSQKRKFFHVHY